LEPDFGSLNLNPDRGRRIRTEHLHGQIIQVAQDRLGNLVPVGFITRMLRKALKRSVNQFSKLPGMHFPGPLIMGLKTKTAAQVKPERALQVLLEIGRTDPRFSTLCYLRQGPPPFGLSFGSGHTGGRFLEKTDHPLRQLLTWTAHQETRRSRGTAVRTKLGKATEDLPMGTGLLRMDQAGEQVMVTCTQGGVVGDAE
jgi:hypothetical protein